MAIRPTDPEALHLYQLIGAPLLAVIQAEAQAAQVSADFISHVGFEPPPQPAADEAASALPPDGVTPPVTGAATAATATAAQPAAGAQAVAATATSTAQKKALQEGGHIGALRVAEFRVDRIGRDGTPIPHVARVPVLSLFPIPLMQVKHAEFDFDIHVVSRIPLENPRATPQEVRVEQEAAQREQRPTANLNTPDYLDPNRVELKGFLANTRGGAGGQAVNDASIKVRVRMEQSDLPAGLIQLMKMMDESVSLVPVPKAPQE